MTITLGIATYNRLHHCINVIKLLYEQSIIPDEIIIIDQSDWYIDGILHEFLELHNLGKINYIFQKEPNLPKARNRILNESMSDIILYIDDDVIFDKFFVERHLSNYNNKNVTAVCGRIFESQNYKETYKLRTWDKYLDYKYFNFSSNISIQDFGIVKGCNHSVRRYALLKIGGYDELYIGSALREEGDMAFRLILKNYTICFDPSAKLHHLQVPAGGCRIGERGQWSASMGSMRFALKFHTILRYHVFSELWYSFRLGVLNKSILDNPFIFFTNSIKFFFVLIINIFNIKRYNYK